MAYLRNSVLDTVRRLLAKSPAKVLTNVPLMLRKQKGVNLFSARPVENIKRTAKKIRGVM